MKLILALVASVVLSACASTFNQVHYEPLRQATYAVTDKDGNAFCSGTLIDSYTFLTAAHCKQDEMYVDGRLAKFVKENKDTDLMVLGVEKTCPCIPLADKPVQMDDDVVVVGYPLGMAQYITMGSVQGPILWKDNPMVVNLFAHTAHAAPGNSGGGVFTETPDGWRLVGVTHAVAVAPIGGFIPNLMAHMSLAIKLERIKELYGN